MTTTTQQRRTFRLSGRMIMGALILFALSLPELCSAAEAVFGPGRHYSVQLPQGWVSTLDEKNNTLGANGPGGLTLNAMVASTETSPEGLMEKIITSTEQKKPGYKLLEKGTVTSKSGHKAHVHRYQLEAKDGPQMWINYFFQLTEKEVVLLVFAFPMNTAKPPKKEIEAIFDSVKVATAKTEDESWTDSSAGPATSPRMTIAPSAPAGPKTAGTRITFATKCSVELPAGWTGKAVGANLEGKGPDGAILHGTSMQGVDLPAAIALRAISFKTKVQEVDTDDVSTKAGLRGKLKFYRYNDKGATTAEVDVFIEAPNQAVTLKFIAPNTPGKLDDNFSQAVEHIFTSLQITE